MTTATALASVATLPQPNGMKGLVISNCDDCSRQIVDHTTRIFCDPCISQDDVRNANIKQYA